MAAHRGVRVYGADAWIPLVEFWQETLLDPERVAAAAFGFYPMTGTRRYGLQRLGFTSKFRYERAALFFALCRSGFGGMIHSGLSRTTSHGEGAAFTIKSIMNLHGFHAPLVTVDHADVIETLHRHPKVFAYLDPPYFVTGHRLYLETVDHNALAAALRRRKSPWVLSYDNCPEVRELYTGYRFEFPRWAYGYLGKKTDENTNEILIMNF